MTIPNGVARVYVVCYVLRDPNTERVVGPFQKFSDASKARKVLNLDSWDLRPVTMTGKVKP
jgi:hypothetical protein